MSKNQEKIPVEMAHHLSQRDQTPLVEEDLIKVQFISMMPGIAKNYRYIIKKDGSLFYAANAQEPPVDRQQIYNRDLPEKPNRVLSKGVIESIQAAVQTEDFFSQPGYQASSARDGSLYIVTARQGGQVHEVWYVNIDNKLINLLSSISPIETPVSTPEEELDALRSLLVEMEQRNKTQSTHEDDPK